MSFRELVEEMKLENKVIAITRVNKAYEKPQRTRGCIYNTLKDVMKGETIVTALDYCTCHGFNHNSGLIDSVPDIPGGFGRFISKGSQQIGAPPGERFKCDQATAFAMFDNLPKDVMDWKDAFRIEPYKEGLECDVVVAFCNADQLSALIVLHGYDKGEIDRVIATTVSGCASMFRMPLAELKSDKPRAIITGTDLAQRHFMDEGEVAIAFTGPEFQKMLDVTEECFFHSPVWKPVRDRLHAND